MRTRRLLATAPVVAVAPDSGFGDRAQVREQAVLAADPATGKRTATWKRALDGVEPALPGAPPSLWHASTRHSTPLGSCDAFSESGVATLVRLRGKRRLPRFAGSLGGSDVAFRGIRPDPATAIRAVTGSGLYDG